MDYTKINAAKEILVELASINAAIPELQNVTSFSKISRLLDGVGRGLVDLDEITTFVLIRLEERKNKLEKDYKTLNL